MTRAIEGQACANQLPTDISLSAAHAFAAHAAPGDELLEHAEHFFTA
jgi:hypothetical protein